METLYTYDTTEFPFKSLVASVFDNHALNRLHELIPDEETPTELFTQKTDSNSFLHKKFYARLHEGWPELIETYQRFICEVIKPIVDSDELIYQKTPTFRAHIPNNLAVGAFHRDKDYNHPPNEINFIIPLTDCYESNTLITESEPDKMDFHQIEMKHGQLLKFDGNNCTHGSLPNRTGVTRVSMDFRVVLPEKYDEHFSTKSMTRKMKFVVGGYYEKI